jgi:isoquinoline 1-oxidoreductase beta subunit
LGRDGLPEAWHYRVVAQPLISSLMKRGFSVSLDFDRFTKYRFLVEGADDLPYGIPNQQIEVVPFRSQIPIGFWRSNGHGFNAFFKEGFLDECALSVKADPLQYRRDLLRGNPRWLRILDTLEQHAQWGRPLRAGQGRGIALHRSYGTLVGQVAEATFDPSGGLSVDRVVCVVDCGMVVHPDTVRAQMEGAIIFALSAVLYGEITIERGDVVQSNFHDYPMVRLRQSPEIDTVIVPSDSAPTGAGEPAVPAAFGAISNAISAAWGKRVRSLPVTKLGLSAR